MITYSIINKSQLEGNLRLDAEYYRPEYLELIENINNLGAVPIRNMVANPKRKFKPQKDKVFQYIEISEVDLSTGEYNKREILGRYTPDRAQWIVRQNDVIISTVRPIRNAVSLIKEDIENLVCSSGFAILKPEKIEPEYLFIYLKSKPIVELLDRMTTATMYPAITVEDILKTKIYLGNQKFRNEIKNEVLEAEKETEKSKSFYSQAENLLLEELGLKDFKVEDDLFYVVNLSNVKSAHRTDAEYFQPKYRLIEKKLIKDFKAKKIRDFNFIEITTGQYSEEYIEAALGKPYIRGTDLSGTITVKLDNLVYIDSKKQLSSKKAKCGDVVVTRVGTVGISARLPKEVEGGTISDNLIRLSFPEERLNSYYVSLFLNSIGSQFMIRESRGSVQSRLNQETLKEIVLPVLPKATQQKIADLVRKSHEARKKAKELLEEAKTKVEKLIEK